MQRQNSLGDKSEEPEMKKKPACGREEKSQGLGMNVSEALEQRLSKGTKATFISKANADRMAWHFLDRQPIWRELKVVREKNRCEVGS